MQNELAFEGLEESVDWTKSQKIQQPIRRMLQLWNKSHPGRTVANTIKLIDTVHEDANMVICEVHTGLGKAFAILCHNTPHGQATVYHRKSKPPVTTVDQAVRLARGLHNQFEQSNAN